MTPAATLTTQRTRSQQITLALLLYLLTVLAAAWLLTATGAREQAVIPIPLAGRAAETRAEYSGMAWYGDTLVLLPQFPSRYGGQLRSALLGIHRSDLLAYLDGTRTEPVETFEIPFSPNPVYQRDGFEGFEAIAFDGNRVYLTIETSKGTEMGSYLAVGTVAPGLTSIILSPETTYRIPLPAQMGNFSNEALVIDDDRAILIYEANGVRANPQPHAQVFEHVSNFRLRQAGKPIPIPNVEYRLTDATPPDDQGRFWAINFFLPVDLRLLAFSDPLDTRFGQGPTHALSSTVERLVELQITPQGIVLTDTPPIQLALGLLPRNWEGIAPLDRRGFFIVTDKFPDTMLAFVKRE